MNDRTPPPVKNDRAIAKNTLRALRAARDGAETTTVEPDVVEPDVVEPDVVEPAVADEPEVVDEPAVRDEPASPDEPATTEVAEPVVLKKSTPKTKLDLPPSKPGARSTVAKKAATATKSATASKAAAPPRRRASRFTIVASVLATLALAFAVIAGVVWWRAGHDDDRGVADTRDTVALQSRLDIEAVNTSDYNHAADALTKWLSVSSGSLHDQFAQSRADAITLLKKAKIVTTATVLDAAVTALNPAKGTATVIASVNVRKKPAKGAAATTRNRFRASMTRVGGQWKLSNLALVSVQLS